MNIPPATRWSHYIPVIMLAFLFVALASQFVDANEPGAGASPPQHFDRHIAPLLASRCLECHIGEKPEGGLDLSRRESALAGGDSGAAIVANRPQASLLWQRVDSDEMPPKHPLDDNERRLLKQWLADGAVWGSGPIDPFQHTTDRRAGYDWWSLQPLTQVQPPEVEDANWVRGDIDRFILAQLQQAGLAPSPPADPRTLVRRLYFDLIGLPPTPDEVATFVADPSDAEYERMVDRLLASLHYGARWSRIWSGLTYPPVSVGFTTPPGRVRDYI